MNNKSNFLNLPSDLSGDARRHVPFRSIIHKPFCLILAFVFLFTYILLVPVSVKASALPSGFKPYIRPVYNTTIEDFQAAYSELSGDELTIFLIIAGAYVMNYAGLGDFGLVFEDPPQDATVKERLEFFGQQLVDTLFLPQNLFIAAFDPLLSYLQGAIVKAKNTSLSEFEADLGGGGSGISFGVLLPYNADLVMSFNQFYYRFKGLYQWQFDSKPFISSVTWKTSVLSAGKQLEYDNYISQINKHSIRSNARTLTNLTNVKILSDNFDNYTNLFIDSDDHTFFVVDDSGNTPSSDRYEFVGFNANYSSVYNASDYLYNMSAGTNFDMSNYDTYIDLVNGIYNFEIYNNGSQWLLYYQDFIKHVYVGNNWGSRSEIFNINDLGISNTISNNLEVPKAPTLLDLSAVIEALQGLGTAINDLRTVIIDNSYIANSGQLVVESNFDLSTLSEIIPESGIDIPDDLFTPLTKEGGYISYLWYMTKPLVQYTSDFVNTMVFDGTEDFDFIGPGAIVFGVISLGLIGGLVVKCLL